MSESIKYLAECKFLGTDADAAFAKFIREMPQKHWSRYDLSAVRLGWEAHKVLGNTGE